MNQNTNPSSKNANRNNEREVKKAKSVTIRLYDLKNLDVLRRVVRDTFVMNINLKSVKDILSEHFDFLLNELKRKKTTKLTIALKLGEFLSLPKELLMKVNEFGKLVVWKLEIADLNTLDGSNLKFDFVKDNELALKVKFSTLLNQKEFLLDFLMRFHELKIKLIDVIFDYENYNVSNVNEINAMIKRLFDISKESYKKNGINNSVDSIDDLLYVFKFVNVPLCAFKDVEFLTPFFIKKNQKGFYFDNKCNNCSLKDYCQGIPKNVDLIINPISTNEKPKFLKHIGKKRYNFYDYVIKIKPTKNNIYDTYALFLMGADIRDPFFNREQLAEYWEEWVDEVKKGKMPEMIYLYIHFPYCISNCSYCIYPSTIVKSKQDIENFVNFIIDELKFFAPIFKGIKFHAFNMGGGTPSLLSGEQLDRILSHVFTLYEFAEGAEKGIEFNPESTTLDKLRVLEKYKFDKLSIGVQSLSPRVLRYANRAYQTLDVVKRFFKYFRQTSLPFLNVDLVMGLYSDTVEDFLYTVEELCKLRPNLISVYPLKTDKSYIQKWYGSEEKFFEFYYPYVDEIIRRVPEIVKKYDMDVSYNDPSEISYIHPFDIFDPHAKTRNEAKYHYANFTKLPYSLLALGFYANGHIAGKLHYMFRETKEITSTLFIKRFSHDPKDYAYFVMPLRKNYEEVKFLVYDSLEHYILHKDDFKKVFGKSIYDVFPKAIDELKAIGLLKETEKEYIFNVKNEREIYVPFLFFLDEDSIVLKIKPFLEYTNPYVRDLEVIDSQKLSSKEREKIIKSLNDSNSKL